MTREGEVVPLLAASQSVKIVPCGQMKMTSGRQRRFCDHLSVSGNVRAACSVVGVSAPVAYKYRRRSVRFALAWDAALVLAREHAEAVDGALRFDELLERLSDDETQQQGARE